MFTWNALLAFFFVSYIGTFVLSSDRIVFPALKYLFDQIDETFYSDENYNGQVPLESALVSRIRREGKVNIKDCCQTKFEKSEEEKTITRKCAQDWIQKDPDLKKNFRNNVDAIMCLVDECYYQKVGVTDKKGIIQENGLQDFISKHNSQKPLKNIISKAMKGCVASGYRNGKPLPRGIASQK
ncbi:uncharacterized protein [Periplaneta americana]|uniref:uncharacterized protein isoform X2 n=1 Tax=Periplaneta americana TaxID=6978 RepID=UPI0037E9C143